MEPLEAHKAAYYASEEIAKNVKEYLIRQGIELADVEEFEEAVAFDAQGIIQKHFELELKAKY